MQMALVVAAVSLVLALVALNSVRAVAPGNPLFQRTWERTDKPVVDGVISRTLNWGPEAFSNVIQEPYTDAPGGERDVQYFDKSRMEDNSYRASPPWDVTNGLLVVEMMTGRMQVGDNGFEDRFPADVPVAGDVNDGNGITYELLAEYRDSPPVAEGTTYTQRLHPDGTLTNEPALAGLGVNAAFLDNVTNHRVAAPFWEFMNSVGPVYEDGQFVDELLFLNPFYSTGRPITEFYWVTSVVAGLARDVGIQCFERRCLTYTPGNPEDFVVEAGNVGLHYWIWRYETQLPTATPTATATATATATWTATSTASATATATSTSTEEFVDVIVNNQVDCDASGAAAGLAGVDGDVPARDVGAVGACQAYLGGEVTTVQDGSSTTADEVQELGLNDATGGTISITFDHPDTVGPILATGIDHNSTAAQIHAILNGAFLAVGVGADTPTVAPVSSDPNAQLNEAAMRFTFENGSLAGTNVPLMEVNNAPLIGETTAGTFSTIVEGSTGQDEIQNLSRNFATSGSFTLTIQHPSAGPIAAGPIPYNATAAVVAAEITSAFAAEGEGGDAPSVSGGPANAATLEFTFENGDLAGTNVALMTVNNGNLATIVQVSKVEVFDAEDNLLTTWQVDSLGRAQGTLEAGTYDFCLTYTEDSGQTDTVCTGDEAVSEGNRIFDLVAVLEYT
jgi:hypothetical protein